MQFNYKKQSIVILFPTLCIPLSVYIFSLLMLFFAKPIYTEAEYWIHDVMLSREILYEQREKQFDRSLYIVSDSNSLFGFSSEILEENLSYNVYNLGTHGSIPLSFHLNYVKQFLKSGDIVVLPLVYNYISSSEEFNDWIYQQFSTWGRTEQNYKNFLSSSMKKELLKKNLQRYWVRLSNIGKELPIHSETDIKSTEYAKNISYSNNAYSYTALTMYGDFLINKSSQNGVANKTLIPTHASDDFRILVNDFLSFAKMKNISVYFTYPTRVNNEDFDAYTDSTKNALERYESIFRDLGYDFFGTKEFYNLPKELYLDTEYHLNATGAVARSLFFIEDFNTQVLNKKPSYDKENASEQANFIEETQETAKEIIRNLIEGKNGI